MAKPEEVLVVENENGEVIREQFKVKFISMTSYHLEISFHDVIAFQ